MKVCEWLYGVQGCVEEDGIHIHAWLKGSVYAHRFAGFPAPTPHLPPVPLPRNSPWYVLGLPHLPRESSPTTVYPNSHAMCEKWRGVCSSSPAV